MKVSGYYKPQIESIKKGRYNVFARMKFQMFVEMEDEFNSKDYPNEFELQLDGEEDDNDNWTYEYDFEYPYGTFEISLFIRPKLVHNDDDSVKNVGEQPIPDAEVSAWFRKYLDPIPISTES